MNVEFNSAEETRTIANEYFEKKKKKEIKPLLREIKKDINCAAKLGRSGTQVNIPKYLEEEVLSILKNKGYEVNQVEKINSWGGFYADNPPYDITWENKGE